MTALIYLLNQNYVSLAMDTLSLSMDKHPHHFTTKVFPLLHLHGVIVGTGCANLLFDWVEFVQKNVLAQDILYLNEITPEQLRNIADNNGYLENSTSTIYHFGYHEEEKRFIGFAYRSTNNFQSEELQYSVAIKPNGEDLQEIAIEIINNLEIPEAFIEIMKLQKEFDNCKESDERLGIGGEIHFFHMTKEGQLMMICHRFDDYYQVWAEMLSNLGSGSNIT